MSTIKTTAHKKLSLNCLALNEMQKAPFNNVRVVAQIDKATQQHSCGDHKLLLMR